MPQRSCRCGSSDHRVRTAGDDDALLLERLEASRRRPCPRRRACSCASTCGGDVAGRGVEAGVALRGRGTTAAPGPRLGLRVGLGRMTQRQVGELVGARLGQPLLGAALAVGVDQLLGPLVGRQEAGERVLVIGHPGHVVQAGAGDPDRRVRLLVRPRPDVDVAVVPEAPFPVERLGRRPGLQDQVVRLLEAQRGSAPGWCWPGGSRSARRARSRR